MLLKKTRSFTMDDEIFRMLKELSSEDHLSNSSFLSFIVLKEYRERKGVDNGKA